ncbi:MAG: hydrolase [Candidatus Woesearchaeota archaeon]
MIVSVERSKTAFVLIDMQEKLLPVMQNIEKVVSNINILIKSAEILKIPLLGTEQNSGKLGSTTQTIVLPEQSFIFEKEHFSCLGCEGFCSKLKDLQVESVILFGIEAHVCVLQTALSAKEAGFEVYIVADAITSRTEQNKELAIERMRQSGIYVVSTEMILYQLLEKIGTEEFRQIHKMLK